MNVMFRTYGAFFDGEDCPYNHSCGHLRRPCNGLDSPDRYAACLHPNLIPKCIRTPHSAWASAHQFPSALSTLTSNANACQPSGWCIRITSKWVSEMSIRMQCPQYIRMGVCHHNPNGCPECQSGWCVCNTFEWMFATTICMGICHIIRMGVRRTQIYHSP